MAMLIQMAVSMAMTRITGREMDLRESSSTRNTAPMAMPLTLPMSAVTVRIRSLVLTPSPASSHAPGYTDSATASTRSIRSNVFAPS